MKNSYIKTVNGDTIYLENDYKDLKFKMRKPGNFVRLTKDKPVIGDSEFYIRKNQIVEYGEVFY